MTLRDLILKNRSYRRFYQDHVIDQITLEELVELARLTPSAANKQPLKYVLSHDGAKNRSIFPALGWASYLKEWPGPDEGERPSAYIVICTDTSIDEKVIWGDHSIAAMAILLGAAERGLGGCMIGNIKKENLSSALQIPERYSPLLVVALGKPKEEVIIDEVKEEEGIRYFRDEKGNHHVPKRSLDDIILKL